MRSLSVVFYRPVQSDHWLNHLVSFMNPPYSHCDLLFDDGTATSIYQNETVYQQKKTFSRKEYEWQSLTFTEDEMLKIRTYCNQCHIQKVQFDFWGMLFSYLPYNPRYHKDKTFCSRFVWEALQKSNRPEFTHKDATSMTPSRIFYALDAMQKTFLDVSSKRLSQL